LPSKGGISKWAIPDRVFIVKSKLNIDKTSVGKLNKKEIPCPTRLTENIQDESTGDPLRTGV
jgi:non-ribosomal peptide synthetase component E (peptide arylation enzyme)